MCGRSALAIQQQSVSKHLVTAKRVLRYLAGTIELGIVYRPPPTQLVGMLDADWGGNLDTRTVFVIMLNRGAIAW